MVFDWLLHWLLLLLCVLGLVACDGDVSCPRQDEVLLCRTVETADGPERTCKCVPEVGRAGE